jgi:hypothetical protein
MKKTLLMLSLCLFFVLNQAISQDKKVLDNEFSIKYNVSNYLDGYNTFFNAGHGLNFQYSRRITEFDELGDKGSLRWAANLNYHRANRKQDIFYYEDLGIITSNPAGNYVIFSDLRILAATAQIQLNYVLANRLEGYAALEAGYYGVLYTFEEVNGSFSSTEFSPVGRGAFAPKIGLIFGLTDHVAISTELIYNVHYNISNEIDPFSSSVNPNDVVNHFYSLALGMSFRF